MYELAIKDYGRVRPLFEGLRYNLVVDSCLDGNTPAWVYANDLRDPHTAWMWNRMDSMLLAGRTDDDAVNQALATLIAGKVIPDARKRQIPELSLHYDPQAWESKLDIVLPGRSPLQALRRYYTFSHIKVDWRRMLPADCEMRRMDEQLLADARLENIQQVVGWVRSFWPTQRDFLDTGFGFCLLEGQAIASWCLSVYASGIHFELGLATTLRYRGRGFATLTAAACVEHCAARGLVPHWHCWEDNLPSIRVAEKVGFVDPTQYTVYRFKV